MQDALGDNQDLPKSWSVKTLPEVLSFISGKAHERHISDDGPFVVVNSKFISSEGKTRKFATHNFQRAKQGDILMVMSDLPNGRALAKTFLVDRDDIYAVNQRVCILRAKRGSPEYFRYQLNRNPYFLSFDDGVQQTHLLNRVFHQCPVVVPASVDEQKAIAAALGDIDDLIASLDALIAKKRDIKQAAMQQLLTGKSRLPGHSTDWGSVPLGRMVEFSKGRGLPKSALNPGGPAPCIHYGELFTHYGPCISTITSRTFDTASAALSRRGDVLMPTSDVTPRGLAKASCVLVDGVIIGGDALIIRPDPVKLNGVFLAYLIRQSEAAVLNLVRGSTVFHIYATDLSRLELHLPKVAEQTAIAEVLTDMDRALKQLAVKRAKAASLKEGMMQQLLTGRIRLI